MSKEEKEIKIELNIPLTEFLATIAGKGFEKRGEVTQRDNYFDTDNWDLYRHVSSMRIRQVDGADHSFAFKKVFRIPERINPHYVEEIEGKFPAGDDSEDKLNSILKRLGIGRIPEVYDVANLESILKANGFQNEQVLSKTRQIFRDKKDNEIVIDDVDDVGTIIELECEDQEPMDVVKELLRDDQWKRSTLGTGYIWLEKVKGFTDHLEHEKRFSERPDWNVMDDEKDMYDGLILSSTRPE